jgi:uncharacterized protein (UPF0276 family)
MKDLLPLVLNYYIDIIKNNQREFLAHFLPERIGDTDCYIAFDRSCVYVDHGMDAYDFIDVVDVIEWCDKVVANADTS